MKIIAFKKKGDEYKAREGSSNYAGEEEEEFGLIYGDQPPSLPNICKNVHHFPIEVLPTPHIPSPHIP